MVKIVEIPVDGIHPDAARQRIDVVGLVTKSDLVADEQIIKSKFVSGKDGGAALSYQIADGKRAMTVSVENWSGVAGYIEKGDLVDIIAVISADPKQSVKADSGEDMEVVGRLTTVVAESAKVLEIGDVGYTVSALEVYKSVTLELSPEQCAKVATAQNMGTITLALRNKADNRVLRKGPYSSKKMLKN
jgi:pilus assembly protein CpaB